MENIEKYILLVCVFLIPLFFLPLFANAFVLPKLIILVSAVSLALIVKCLRTIVKGTFSVSFGTFDVPVLFLFAAYLISAIVRTPNKMEAFFYPGNATIVLAGVLLYFLINSLGNIKKEIKTSLVFSGLIFSVVALFSAVGLFDKMGFLPSYFKGQVFNTDGSFMTGILFLFPLIPLTLSFLSLEKDNLKKIFWGISSFVIAFGLLVSIYNILPGKTTTPQAVDMNTSWSVAVDSLKRSPLWGMGPGNYTTAFNLFKPLSYNQTANWSNRYGAGRNIYLTSITETGLVGLAAWAILIAALVKILKKSFAKVKEESPISLFENSGPELSLLLLLVVGFFIPAGITVWVMIFVYLALVSIVAPANLNLTVFSSGFTTEGYEKPKSSKFPALILTVPIILAVLVLAFFSVRAVRAEAKYKAAMDAVIQNDGKKTYDILREAISLNPYVDRYHVTYAQINLALANTIAANKELSETDRATVAQLIQQAIREGKSGATLNLQRSSNWENLAAIYRSIMAFAEGSAQFAVQSYAQAVALDPINPALRVSLGGIYYSLGMYDEAIETFKLAIMAKPDLANAYYNLSATYANKGEIDKAIAQMTTVLSLVPKDSSDYDVAKADLELLEKQRPVGDKAEESESLTPPQELPEQVIKPPLELPEDATPPVIEEEQVPAQETPEETAPIIPAE